MGALATPEIPLRPGLPDLARSASADVDGQVDVRVVIVDNLHERRQLVAHILELGPGGTNVVGYAEGAATAVDLVDSLNAAAVLLEIQLPIAEGLDAVSALRAAYPHLRIVVCSFHATASTRREAAGRGADEYLVKPVSPRDLSRALLGPANMKDGAARS